MLQQQNEDLKERIDKNLVVSRSDMFECILVPSSNYGCIIHLNLSNISTWARAISKSQEAKYVFEGQLWGQNTILIQYWGPVEIAQRTNRILPTKGEKVFVCHRSHHDIDIVSIQIGIIVQ